MRRRHRQPWFDFAANVIVIAALAQAAARSTWRRPISRADIGSPTGASRTGATFAWMSVALLALSIPTIATSWGLFHAVDNAPEFPAPGPICFLADQPNVMIEVYTTFRIERAGDSHLDVDLLVYWDSDQEKPPRVFIDDRSDASLRWATDTLWTMVEPSGPTTIPLISGLTDVPLVSDREITVLAATPIVWESPFSELANSLDGNSVSYLLQLEADRPDNSGLLNGSRASIRLPQAYAGTINEYTWCTGYGLPANLQEDMIAGAVFSPEVSNQASVRFDASEWEVEAASPPPEYQSSILAWPFDTEGGAEYIASMERKGTDEQDRQKLFVAGALVGVAGALIVGGLQLLPSALVNRQKHD